MNLPHGCAAERRSDGAAHLPCRSIVLKSRPDSDVHQSAASNLRSK